MNDETPTSPEVPAEEAASVKRPLPLIKIGIIAGVLVAQGAAAYFLQTALLFSDRPAVEHAPVEEKVVEKAVPEQEMEVVMLEEIVVNPAQTSGRRYLAITLGLQIAAPEAEKLVDKKKPLIRDALISLLSSKPLDRLADIQYRDSLKHDIRDTVNKYFPETPVANVIFTNYVLQ